VQLQPARRAVLFLHPADEGYGADRVLLIAVDGLIAKGWTAMVLFPDDVDAGWLSGQLAARGVDVRHGPLAPARRRYLSLSGLPGYLLALRRARTFVRTTAHDWKPSVIHVNTTALLVAAILGRPAGARLVWHVHEIVQRPRVLSTVFRVAPVLTADRIIAVSDAVRRWLLGIPWRHERVIRIHNGIPPRAPTMRTGENPLRVAFVGRLNRWKGYEVFVDAVARIAPRYPAARFLIAGDPPAGEEWRTEDLEDRLERAGLSDRVEVLGFRSDVPGLMDSIDIIAVPSIWPDPLPTVVLEAMRAGCAVVASNHGGVPEMLDESSGLVVEPGNSASLAAGLSALLDDPELRRAMGEHARNRVATEFRVERFVDDLDRLYGEMLR
jgi:glycosyltransferase involved in cell wall biosynthesis